MKKRVVEKVTRKKSSKGFTSSNPFELRFTKEKHNVIGRKSFKPVGKPGVSRAKANEKRKGTLLQEYKRINKKNVIVDRRIGENDNTMKSEEKMLVRYAKERMKSHDKKSKFNLGDDEDEPLTHFGQSLAEIERFEDPRSEDEDDDQNDKKLDSKVVDQLHFGGFMDKSDMEFAEGKSNARKEWIESMISESRKKKLDKRKDLEEATEITQSLDAKWREMMTSFKSAGAIYTKKPPELKTNETNKDSYDILMRELTFEPKRAKASERLKTEEEIIKEDKEKLEKLEKDRLMRMEGAIEAEDMEDEKIEDEADDSDDVDEEEDNDDEEEEEEEEDSGDDLDSDLDNEEAMEISKPVKSHKIKTSVESVISEIPYVFDVPESYEDFLVFFDNRKKPSDIETIVSRIVKCNHPQLAPDNKAKMERLFVFLIQYIHDIASAFDSSKPESSIERNAMKIISVITPIFFDVAKFSPQPNAKVFLNLIIEKYDEFCKQPKEYPAFETIIFFKLSFLLFPSSDYRHPVSTPALTFIFHVLSSAKVNSKTSISSGLFLSTLVLECVQLSKRFSPEAINFLFGLIRTAVKKDKLLTIPVVSPFKVFGEEAGLLNNSNLSRQTEVRSMRIEDLLPGEDTEPYPVFVASSLNTAISLVKEFFEVWKDLPSRKEIFDPFLKLLINIPVDQLPQSVESALSELANAIRSVSSKKNPIKQPPKKTTMLRLYEPQIEDDYDPFQKKRGKKKGDHETEKFLHKIKREMKGAKKDIRGDSAFLAKQKAKDIRQRDEERKRKTKEILSGLGNQEGDYRKILNSKKKRR